MFKEPVIVFDIETIPDIDSARRLLGLDDSDDAAVYEALRAQRLATKGTDFMPAHLQRVVAISVVVRTPKEFKVLTIGDEDASEGEIVQKFFKGIDAYSPVLVSWNGGGFDLPVLHYRALLHGCIAPKYWDTGYFDPGKKWDNYLSRYQNRHLDLMDVLALYSGRNNAPLTEIAQMLGFPGKVGMDGSKVFEAFNQGRLADIRAYCETDVVNTYLVYLRFEQMRGRITPAQCEQEELLVRETLEAADAPHWQEFLEHWIG